MKLRTKIIIPKLILVIVLVIAFAFFISYLENKGAVVRRNQAKAQEIIKYTSLLEEYQGEVESNVLAYSLTRQRRAAELVLAGNEKINSTIESMAATVTDPLEKELLNKYRASLVGWKSILSQLLDAIRADDAEATEIAFSKWSIKAQLIHATLTDLRAFSVRTLEQSNFLFQDTVSRAMMTAWLILSIAIALTIVNFIYLFRSVTIPLGILADTANEISRGNFDVSQIKTESKDEIGQLAASISGMAEKLSALYGGLEDEVRKKTKQLSVRNRELERSNKELEDFAYVASHDLQEPLRKIRAFGNLLEDEFGGKLEESAKDYLARMQGAATRMSTLISDLLTFSRVTTRAQPFVKVDLNDVAKEVLSDTEALISETRGKVKVEALPIIDADPLQMRQMIQNLVSNALKFHKKGVAPRIRIYCKESDLLEKECYDIFFEDNGIGIDEKYSDKIFTVFQRLHTREEFEGTGVGLAVVKKIIDRHQGTVSFRSRLGEGTTFIVTLPKNQLAESNQ